MSLHSSSSPSPRGGTILALSMLVVFHRLAYATFGFLSPPTSTCCCPRRVVWDRSSSSSSPSPSPSTSTKTTIIWSTSYHDDDVSPPPPPPPPVHDDGDFVDGEKKIAESTSAQKITGGGRTTTTTTTIRSPLSLTMQELSDKIEGSGRAAVVWDCLRMGVDPNLYYANPDEKDPSDESVADAWLDATGCIMPASSSSSRDDDNIISSACLLDTNMFGQRRRRGQGLGNAALGKLQSIMRGHYHYSQSDPMQISSSSSSSRRNDDDDQQQQLSREEEEIIIYTIENSIATLSHMKVSPDGTTKLLLKMNKDGLEVESVIIPWMDKGFSTLCVSSQVGCKQGCTFCATGRMGKLRSLTADEILVQVYYASKVCRVVGNIRRGGDAIPVTADANILPNIDNIVFMGMGEPADNADAVVRAVNTLADRRMFGLAQSKITVSTVAPDPTVFDTLGRAPAALAWSVHAVDDSLRRSLVPTTKYTMEELRGGLVRALSSRSNKLRRTMLEVALIEDVNDSAEDAERLAAFSQSIMDEVPGSKVVVNLIPYNAIDHPSYRTPSIERVLGFQKTVTDGGVLCYVRTTRGDEESAACGQLATKKKKAVG